MKAEKVLEQVIRTESWKWGHTEVAEAMEERGCAQERRMSRRFLYPAFLPLIGVPPGEVI